MSGRLIQAHTHKVGVRVVREIVVGVIWYHWRAGIEEEGAFAETPGGAVGRVLFNNCKSIVHCPMRSLFRSAQSGPAMFRRYLHVSYVTSINI
jgi:hypothetical protein